MSISKNKKTFTNKNTFRNKNFTNKKLKRSKNKRRKHTKRRRNTMKRKFTHLRGGRAQPKSVWKNNWDETYSEILKYPNVDPGFHIMTKDSIVHTQSPINSSALVNEMKNVVKNNTISESHVQNVLITVRD